MSPLLIFDKSFLQSLSIDEAVRLDQMYSCVITPLFLVAATVILKSFNAMLIASPIPRVPPVTIAAHDIGPPDNFF